MTLNAWIAAISAAALLAGCGDDDAGGDKDGGGGADAEVDAMAADAQASDAALSSVVITYRDRRRTMTGIVDLPLPSNASLDFEVTGSDGAGGTIVRQGTMGPSGSLTIAGVPSGSLFYSFRSFVGGTTEKGLLGYSTSDRHLDLGNDTVGGYGTGAPMSGTNLSFMLTGLTPWSVASGLRLLVPTHNSNATFLTATTPAGITGFPTDGATSLNPLTFPWGRQLPDPTDLFVLVQRESATLGTALSVTRIVKSFAPPVPIVLNNGMATTFTGVMAAPATVTAPVRLDGPAWSAHVPKISPSARASALAITYFGGPPPLDRSIEIASASFASSTATPNIDFSFGDPFTGARAVRLLKGGRTEVLAPGATTTTSLPYATFGATYDLAALPATGMVPVLTPVEAPRIAGLDARQLQNGVGLTPVLSWSAPAIGTPTMHEVSIYQLANDAGATSTILAGAFVTAGDSFQIPPDVLRPGRTYFFAVRSDTYHRPSAPDRTFTQLPIGFATCISAAFTP